ncbi:MAG: hypothetical protein R3E66_18455 [bacterium]
MMWRWTLVMLALAGCGGSEPKPEPTEAVVHAVTPPTANLEDSKCLGNRVPPSNYMQETAFAPVSQENASEVAKLKAVAQLRDRICQGYRCSELEPRITLWNTQQDAVQACAMAVIKASDVDNFLAAPRAEFDADLKSAATEFEGVLIAANKKRIAIDNVRDLGVDGGPRAEWLIDRVAAGISSTKLELVRMPKEWNGLGLPKGIDAILRGRVTRLQGREAMLEVTWNLDLGNQLKSASPVTFPELIGPAMDSQSFADLPGINEKVALRFDARPGGALCNGQTTEMSVTTTEPLMVRVIDLYGNDDALLIWASEGALAPKKSASLGEFMAVKMPGAVAAERFLVVGARQEQDLGPFAAAPIPCRIPKVDAERLHAGEGIPKATIPYSTSRSYRIMDGDACREFDAPPATALDGLPACW